jgi:hypothetical protein
MPFQLEESQHLINYSRLTWYRTALDIKQKNLLLDAINKSVRDIAMVMWAVACLTEMWTFTMHDSDNALVNSDTQDWSYRIVDAHLSLVVWLYVKLLSDETFLEP